MTPYQALYSKLPPPIPAYNQGDSPVHEVDETLLTRDELLQRLKQNLEMAINRMKQTADVKRREVHFKVDDLVLLKIHHQKFASKYYGPFPIIEKLGTVAYKLQLPDMARIHPVFHVSLLKPFVGIPVASSLNLPPTPLLMMGLFK